MTLLKIATLLILIKYSSDFFPYYSDIFILIRVVCMFADNWALMRFDFQCLVM